MIMGPPRFNPPGSDPQSAPVMPSPPEALMRAVVEQRRRHRESHPRTPFGQPEPGFSAADMQQFMTDPNNRAAMKVRIIIMINSINNNNNNHY